MPRTPSSALSLWLTGIVQRLFPDRERMLRVERGGMLDLRLSARENLVAWCVVPCDTRRRGPRARAEMLAGLGLRRLRWDWRPEHVGLLGAELDALAEHGIELTGVWIPAPLPAHDGVSGRLDPDVRFVLDVLRDRGVATQLWTCTEFGPPGPAEPLPPAEHRARVERTAAHLGPARRCATSSGASSPCGGRCARRSRAGRRCSWSGTGTRCRRCAP